ncbi:MAG: hypothetical protein AAF579_17520 [Cyanobacteria bacterium P01_C01_bin.118]
MSRYAVLIGQIERELGSLQQLVHQTDHLMQKVKVTGDLDYLGTIALNLHSFYSGAERIFRDVATDLDGSLPSSHDWHRKLLRQMAANVPDIRPLILSSSTFQVLNELCAFRHVVRNIYSFDLVPEKIEALAANLSNTYNLLENDLNQFNRFLATINGA